MVVGDAAKEMGEEGEYVPYRAVRYVSINSDVATTTLNDAPQCIAK